MTAPAIIQDLVNRFRDSRELYRSGRYNEAQLRQEFLNPFFEALGWDMVNRSNFAPQYREVIHEDSLDDEGSLKAPDYAFRIGTTRKFFVEAKKPAVDIRYAIHPAYQLRRYAWNAHLPLSILTDFEELAVYDCRTRPDPKDSAATGRVMLFTFEEYVERWDEIAHIFSREAVWNGSFDRYAEGSKGKRGTTEVDEEFLKEIEEWRILLARNIALRNFRSSSTSAETPPNLHRAERQLNYAVQTTIDRILFLRICEDRQIEPTDQLLHIAEGSDIYAKLLLLFQKADQKYNSGLFHFSKEKGQTSDPDTFTPSLQIDDKVLRQIIKSTYFPCPYMFNEIPVEILGQVYEQFLGSVIRLTPGGQAKVEEKPEVRKAGGVYYTPRYIVDYIVQNTLGRLLGSNDVGSTACLDLKPTATEREAPSVTSCPLGIASEAKQSLSANPSEANGGEGNKAPQSLTPTQALNLRVVDPACGSGSFLLGAYQYLLDWHLNYYLSHDPQSHTRGKNPPLVATEGGEYRLTTETKKRILTASIYGVDIDSQAVEVTKLSLLLKLLEGETGQLSLGFERVLPDLGQNIRCGNSLIGWDYFKGQMFPDEEERLRVNPFDWQKEFLEVFAKGGFNAVIGNPPYVRIQRIDHIEADYYFNNYHTPTSKADLSLVFIEKSLGISAQKGLIGLICTSQWMKTDYGKNLRSILSNGKVVRIVNFGSLPVFTNASTYPAIYIISPENEYKMLYSKIESKVDLSLEGIKNTPSRIIETNLLGKEPWLLGEFDIISHLNSHGIPWVPLNYYCDALVGALTGMDEAFVVSTKVMNDEELEIGLIFPYALRGAEITRYRIVNPENHLIYPYKEGKDGKPILLQEKDLKTNYPNIYSHLLLRKGDLQKRKDSRKLYASGADWYKLVRPGTFDSIRPPKLIIKGIDLHITTGLLEQDTIFNGANCPGIIVKETNGLHPHFFLGLLNSSLIAYYLRSVCPPKLNGYRRFNVTNLNNIPVRKIDLNNDRIFAIYSDLLSLVSRSLSLGDAIPTTTQEKVQLKRAITSTDAAIDLLVYELYGLTDEEIGIVEST